MSGLSLPWSERAAMARTPASVWAVACGVGLIGLVWTLRLALPAWVGAGLHVDEAQYWLWSRDLQWGYYSKPPLIAALIRVSTTLAGDGPLGVRWLTTLCYPATALVLWRLGAAMAGPRAGRWAAGLFMVSPLAGLLGLVATTDGPLLLAWSLGMWAGWWAVVCQRTWAWALLSLALGVGLLAKYTMLMLVPGLLWFAWWQAGRAAGLRMLASLAIGALLWLPHLAWNAAQGWPTWQHTVEITAGQATTAEDAAWQRLALFTLAQPLIAGPLTLWGWRRGGCTGPAARLLLASAAPLLLVGLVQAAWAGAEINWVAPSLLSAMLAVACAAPAATDRARWQRWVGAAALQATLVAALATTPIWFRLAGGPSGLPPSALDPWARMRAWTPALGALRTVAEAQGASTLVGENRTVLAQAAYAWRGLNLQAAAFNPNGKIDSHFALNCPWHAAAQRPGPFLVLTAGPPSAALWAAFRHWVPLQTVSVPRSRGRTLTLHLARADQPMDGTPHNHPAKACR